jgi:hypothetical protein
MIRILTLLVSLFSFGLVQLAEINYEIPVTDILYFNDTPIEELNGLTLNQVFVDGNIFDLILDSGIDFDYQYTTTGTPSYFAINQISHNDNVYILIKGNVVGGNGTGLTLSLRQYQNTTQIISNPGNILISTDTTETLNTFLITISNNVDRFGLRGGGTTPINIYDFDLLIINLTNLSISTTQAQLDRYYELWLNPELNITYEINELDTQDLVLLLASQSVWTIMIHLLYKYAYRPKKKSKRLGM